jgi:hypothetical protein
MSGTEHGDSSYYGGSGGSAGLGAYCWKIVVPQATTNRCLNPQAGTTGNFAAVGGGGAAIARVTTSAKFGLYSYSVTTTGDNEGCSFTLGALPSGATVTMYAKGTLPPAWDWSLDNVNYHAPQAILSIDADWTLYGYSFGTGEAVGSTTLYVRQSGAGAGPYVFQIDGVQVENGTDWTTYCDGDQEGCDWNGVEHASTSTRGADTRAGGIVQDLKLDYGFGVADAVGWGAAQQSVTVGRYALLPGGELDNIKQESRRAVLAGDLRCSSTLSVNDRRQDLLSVLSPSSVPRGKAGYQPVRLWFICADVVKEIAAHYESGLDMDIKPDDVARERIAVRFVADDPTWREIGTSCSHSFTTTWHGGFKTFYLRRRDTGRWSQLANPAMTLDSTINTYAILHASDHKVYLGGQWENLGGIANADRIAYFDQVAWSFNAMGTGIGSGTVRVIREAPNGDIYVAGDFTDAGGVGAADYIARWDGSSWNAVGTPAPTNGSPIVYDMAFDRSGNLYVVGDFENFTGGATALDYIAMWNGSAWSAVGTPNPTGSGALFAVCVDSQNNVFIGGDFTDWTGVASDMDYWAKWDGSSWSAIFALNSWVRALWADPRNDDVYVGGNFTSANGVTNANYIFRYDGTEARSLSSGLDGTVYKIAGAPDGTIYLVGSLLSAGGVDVTRVALWNGASFAHVDIRKGSGLKLTVEVGQVDPIIERKYDLWVGDAATAAETAYFGGGWLDAVTNSGTEAVYPKFKVKRDGGQA